MIEIPELYEQIDQLGSIGGRLSDLTSGVEGMNNDPKMVAATLYIRAWGHFTAFSTLWRSGHILECDIILRCSVETAICIANVLHRPDEFIEELRADAASTMRGQVHMMRKRNYGDFVDEIATGYKELFGESKGRGLVWSELAEKVNANELYGYHKALSGVAAHVTGISVLRGIASEDGSNYLNEGGKLRTLGWMCATMAATCLNYAAIIGADDLMAETAAVIDSVMKVANIADDED